jgi:adenylate cyclase
MTRKTATGILLGLGAAAIVLFIAATGALDKAEMILYDWRMRSVAPHPPDVSPDIVLVEINDTTIRDLDPVFGRWPWPRAAFALLIDFLNRAPAKVIAVDLGFYEKDRVLQHQIGTEIWTGADSDNALVASVKAAPGTILLADAVYEGLAEGEQVNKAAEWRAPPYRLDPRIFERRAIVTPFAELNDAAATLGHSFAALDAGGSLRRIVPFVRTGDRYMPSLGVAAALRGAEIEPEEVELQGNRLRIRDRLVPLVPISVKDAHTGTTVEQLTMLVNYRAPALMSDGTRPFKSFEARHLLQSEIQLLSSEKPSLDPALFKGKIVFVGLTASGLVDVFQTPFDSRGQGKMPGIQMHASVADSILSNRFIDPRTQTSRRVIDALAGAVAVGLLAAFLPFTRAALLAVAAMIALTWYDWYAFRQGSWLNMTQPLSAMALSLFAGTAYQYFVEGREKRVVKRLFGRYVSKDVYQQLLENPERAALGGTRRDMTVLFSDIRGFTSVTEKGDPQALVSQLNDYFSRMVEIVFRHHGTVDKFVGDMVMALYGAPLDDQDHAEHAVAAAVEMVRELGELNRKWAAENRAQLDIGIGVNSGDMIAGNIGSSSIMSYTVIGDNVNLGSRLESLNKDYKTRIIISDATRSRLKGSYEIVPLGDVVVKGKTRPVAIFEIKVPSPLSAASEVATL